MSFKSIKEIPLIGPKYAAGDIDRLPLAHVTFVHLLPHGPGNPGATLRSKGRRGGGPHCISAKSKNLVCRDSIDETSHAMSRRNRVDRPSPTKVCIHVGKVLHKAHELVEVRVARVHEDKAGLWVAFEERGKVCRIDGGGMKSVVAREYSCVNLHRQIPLACKAQAVIETPISDAKSIARGFGVGVSG